MQREPRDDDVEGRVEERESCRISLLEHQVGHAFTVGLGLPLGEHFRSGVQRRDVTDPGCQSAGDDAGAAGGVQAHRVRGGADEVDEALKVHGERAVDAGVLEGARLARELPPQQLRLLRAGQMPGVPASRASTSRLPERTLTFC